MKYTNAQLIAKLQKQLDWTRNGCHNAPYVPIPMSVVEQLIKDLTNAH